MKKITSLLLSVMMVFLLVACGSKEASQTQAVQTQDVQSQASDQFTFQGEMPLESKLVFGSLMLEETDMAITPEQAEELLPLWKLYTSLLDSDTAAGAEIDAVLNSIQDAMTADQLDYIQEMQLDPGEMRQMMEDLGITFGFRGGTGQDEENSTEGFTPPGGFGGVPGQGPGQGTGGGPGFGPGGGDFSNFSPEQQATAQAMRDASGGSGRGFFANTALVDALIGLLEGKLE
jgi:hypothetical protein